MPWVKVDDHFDEHPKLAKVGPLGWALWMAGLAYCNRNLTDGFIPWSVARKLVNWEGLRITSVQSQREVTSDYVIDLLVQAGIWAEVPDGYQYVDLGLFQLDPSHQSIRDHWNSIRKLIAPKIFRRDGYRCLCCGTKKDLTVDHILALSCGGGNEETNLQTLCRACNSRKGAR